MATQPTPILVAKSKRDIQSCTPTWRTGTA